MHRGNAISVATVLALTAVAVGCAPRTTNGAAGNLAPEAACSGQAYVDVHNSLETTVDVYAYPEKGGVRRYLGNAAPGTTRLPLTGPVGAVYAEVGGRRITERGPARGETGGITVTHGCANE